jgi:hypothetical protein
VQSRDFAPVQTLALRKQLQQLEIKTEPKLVKSLSDNDLPALQQLLQAELTKLRTDLAELETLLTSQTQRTQLAQSA